MFRIVKQILHRKWTLHFLWKDLLFLLVAIYFLRLILVWCVCYIIFKCIDQMFRSSHRKCFVKKRSATLLKKRLWHRCFPVNLARFLRPTFFTEHFWVAAFECFPIVSQVINFTGNFTLAAQWMRLVHNFIKELLNLTKTPGVSNFHHNFECKFFHHFWNLSILMKRLCQTYKFYFHELFIPSQRRI